MDKDYIIIQFDGTPLGFTDDNVFETEHMIVVYNDYNEAVYDSTTTDLGISTIYYSEENGENTATVTKPNSEDIIGLFTYDDELDNFQTELKAFLKAHPFC